MDNTDGELNVIHITGAVGYANNSVFLEKLPKAL